MRATRRASSRNIATNSEFLAKLAWSRLTATVRETPAAPLIRAKCTEAIPPVAISPKSRYRPIDRGRGASDTRGTESSIASKVQAGAGHVRGSDADTPIVVATLLI